MRPYFYVAATVLLVFSLYTDWVVWQHGYLGFVHLALREPWGMQMLLDLGIALALFSTWMIPDAKARGHSPWLWLVLTGTMGSIGPLGYLTWRGFCEWRATKRGA